MFNETIVAQSTPYGQSSVGILRISGSHAKFVAKKILGIIPVPRSAYYAKFLDYSGAMIDEGIAIWFPKPHSFTGEDILELQGHGNPIILDLLIKTIISFKNIRLANPGEFSERAFLNGKMDLIQAESIMDLINAHSEASVKSALQSLQGTFSKEINILINQIIEIRVVIEAIINFPEDEMYLSNNIIDKKLKNILMNVDQLHQIAYTGSILREGVKVVLVGQPNVGKSSIFNKLLLNDTAIVTDIEGTTRDVLHECINIHGIKYHLTDTAGLRFTNNIIEKIGIRKTWEQIKLADHVLFIIDDTIQISKKEKIISDFMMNFPKNIRITILFNKADLSHNTLCVNTYHGKISYITISAKTGYGIDILKNHLKESAIGLQNHHFEGVFLARRRHLKLLELSMENIKKAKSDWKMYKNIEFLAEDLKLVQNILGEITGLVTSDHILHAIFSSFCIGK